MIKSEMYVFLRIQMRRMILYGGFSIILLFIPHTDLNSQDVIDSIRYEGLDRNFLVYFPEDYSNDEMFPLIIYLHGLDWDAEDDLNYTGFDIVAVSNGYIFVAPNAVDMSWNSLIDENPELPQPDVDDVGFINALIDTLSRRYQNVDHERIYVCGLSAGGIMTYTIASRISHRLAAIASVGGFMGKGISDSYNRSVLMPVLHIHGTADNYVPDDLENQYRLSVDNTLAYFTDVNNCIRSSTILLPDIDTTDNTTVEKIKHTFCTDSINVVYYKIINGGHNWPGALIDYGWEGNKNGDINAGVEILNFFEDYTREIPVGIENDINSGVLNLIQNYPNPFTQKTTISFNLDKSWLVTLRVFSLTGEEVITLVSERLHSGSYEFEWDASSCTGGIYYCKLSIGKSIQVKKMILIK
ncbi:T9SS type A sorting domain-containing protein [Bacteroidota bacterium]